VIDKIKTLIPWARYFLINGIFAASIYFGLFLGIEGPTNLALFMGWVTGILGTAFLIILLLAGYAGIYDKFEESVSRTGSPLVVPFWFDLIFDLCVVAAFVWTGHYILTIFYIISIIVGKIIRDIPKNVVLRTLTSQQS